MESINKNSENSSNLLLFEEELEPREQDFEISRLHDATFISSNVMEKESLASILQFPKKLCRNLLENGISSLFPVQNAVVRWILSHMSPKILIGGQRDLCITSPTGSGKTLSYVIPIIHLLSWRFVPQIQALVVVPTQDLAIQVWNVFKSFSKGTKLKAIYICGGEVKLEVEQRKLIKRLHSGSLESKVDILIATPGRLVEHIRNTKGFTLEHLKFLVIDEADIVLEKMSNDWLNLTLSHMKEKGEDAALSNDFNNYLLFHAWPMKLLFSATLLHNAINFQSLNLFRPKFILCLPEDSGVGEHYIISKNVTEHYIVADDHLKPLVIYDFVINKKWNKILIFCNSNEEAHRLAHLLKIIFPPESNVSEITTFQSVIERKDILEQFAEGRHKILVTSDRMARGIDFPGVNYVISYHPAKFFRTYIHRAGRTGRAGHQGNYITILNSKLQGKLFQNRMANLNRINVNEIEFNASMYKGKIGEVKVALEKLSKTIKEEQNEKISKIKLEKNPSQISKKRNMHRKNKKSKRKRTT